MKYKLLGENEYFQPINQILRNRNIQDTKRFIKPTIESAIPYDKLVNIKKAVKCFLHHAYKGGKITVQVDTDVDGYTSAASLISYIKKAFPKLQITYLLHEGKEHGVILDKVPDNTDLLFIPDAGSNQYEKHQSLKEKGIDVIILDHHEAEKLSEDAIVVNNQMSPEYSNMDLSGVGIVYKFLQALDDELGVNYADNYLDLVAIGNIADMMKLDSEETRYLVFEGLKKIKNKFLVELFKAQSYSTKDEATILNAAFYIVPPMNATIRIGSHEEKDQMFRALLESDEEILYEYRKTRRYEHIAVNTARLVKNIKSRQDTMRDRGVKLINEQILENNLTKNKILIVNSTNLLDKNLNGLVGNQLSKLYKRPILLIREKEDDETLLVGSARGYEKGFIKDFKTFVRDTGYFNMAEGHANAYGVEIEKDKIEELNKYINELLKDVEIDENVYEVDFEFSHRNVDKNVIAEIHDYRHLWGGGIDEPLFAYKELKVDKHDFQLLGKNERKTLKFKVNGVEFIKFGCYEDWFNEIFGQFGMYVMNVVGKAKVNEWRGVYTPQIFIEDLEVVEVQDDVLF